jgi:hypothetical protein
MMTTIISGKSTSCPQSICSIRRSSPAEQERNCLWSCDARRRRSGGHGRPIRIHAPSGLIAWPPSYSPRAPNSCTGGAFAWRRARQLRVANRAMLGISAASLPVTTIFWRVTPAASSSALAAPAVTIDPVIGALPTLSGSQDDAVLSDLAADQAQLGDGARMPLFPHHVK